MAVTGAPAHAATLYWSGNGTNAGGNGTWNTSAAHFGPSGGPYTTVWSNSTNAADTVILNSTAGIVTLGANITVRTLNNTTNGTWTVAGGAGPYALSTGGASNLSLQPGANATLVVSAAIGGSSMTGGISAAGNNATGQTILTGANTYSGTTIITGNLQLGNGASGGSTGSIGSSSGINIDQNGSTKANLTINRSNQATQGTDFPLITGVGDFTKSGNGTTIFTLANTYSGTTGVTAGTLQMGNGSTTGSLANTASITVSSGATFAVNRSDSVSQSSAFKLVGGGGNFTQAGTGTTTFTSANTYSGLTTVQGGVLRYGIANAISSGGVTITSGAALDLATFNDSVGAVTLTSGTILGSGTLTSTSGFTLTSGSVQAPLAGAVGLTMQGGGLLPLTGANLYTGATTVSSGTLQMGNGSTAGSIGSSSSVAVSTNAIFAINRSDNVTQGASFFPVISGAGGFQQAGSGTTTLASINTYTGPTSVVGGALAITGTLAATAITVSSAAILGGSGTTAGTVTFNAGSKFLFNAAAPLNVGGSVTFSDPASFGVDDIVGLDSSVAEGTYTLIAGNVTTTNLANLGSSNAYDLGSGKSAYFQQGSLQVVVVPEPASLSAAAAVAGLSIAMVMRRRKTYTRHTRS